ncbi:hypothetical protein D3C86_876090 [compost metagenome]
MTWTVSDLVNNLNTTFAPAISDQLNHDCPTLGIIPKTLGSGKNIAWDAKVARGTKAGSYDGASDINPNDKHTEVPAVLNWKFYKGEFKVTGAALAIAQTAGPEAYADLFGKAIDDAVTDLADKMGAHVFADGTTNSGLDYDGLAAIVNNTGNYAGLSRTTYPVWRSTVLASGGTPRDLSVALLRQAETAIFKASGKMFDAVVMDPDLYEKYEAMFDSSKRLNNPQGFQSADAGIAQLFFKGVPVIRDINCPSGTVYLLNTRYLEFQQLPPVTQSEGQQLVEAQKVITNEDGSTGIQVAIELNGKSGDNYKGFVKVYGNFKCERPNVLAVIKDVQ